jgi:hypothetical protein
MPLPRVPWSRSVNSLLEVMFELGTGLITVRISIDDELLQENLLAEMANPRFFSASGTNQECRYKLMTFGIPTNILPIDNDGTFLLDNHREWIQQRLKLEGRNDNKEGSDHISAPGPFDILMGRSKVAQEHSGNIRYKHLIETHSDRYEDAPKSAKTTIAKDLVQMIKDSGGRFLRFEQGTGWVEVEDAVAREKGSMAFRDKRQLSRKLHDCEPGPGVTMTLSSLFGKDPRFIDRTEAEIEIEGKRPRNVR